MNTLLYFFDQWQTWLVISILGFTTALAGPWAAGACLLAVVLTISLFLNVKNNSR